MSDFRKIIAWQKAIELVDRIYDVTSQFPDVEKYCLAIQMKRAALGVTSDIAEGAGRYTVPDQRHLYREARGSVQEVESDIEIAIRRHFVTKEQGEELIARAQEVCRLINGLIKSLD